MTTTLSPSTKLLEPRALDWPTARRLAVEHHLDPRTVIREHREPGCVRGDAGRRARVALTEAGY